jgi:DNA-binding transcriptional LysR family regulator
MGVRYDDLPALALFAEVVRARSFSEAARKLGIAKSAVSKRIAKLEAQLGVLLLTRTTRKLALTSEGARFFEHCDALLREADLAAESVSGASEEARGVVRINAPVSFGQLHLARAIAPFLRAQPEIAVSLSVDDRMVDVIEGGFDLVIRVTRLTQASSLVAKKLASSRLVVCGSPAYLAERGTPAHPSELLAHDCLHYELVPFAAEWRFRGPDGPFVVPSRKSFGSTNGTVLREAAIAGIGLAVLPWFIVARDVAEGRLALVLEGARRAQIGIYAVFAHRRHLPLRTRLLVDHLAAYFRRAGWEVGT